MNHLNKRKWAFLACLLLLFFEANIYAQTFRIESSSANSSDLSAQIEPRSDLNGVKCGLLKVRCVLSDVSFKGNIIGEVKQQNGEYWVYMSNGSKNISLYHPKLLPLDIDFESLFKSPIKSASTYIVALSIPNALYSSTLNQQDNSTINSEKQSNTTENFENSSMTGVVTDKKDGEPLIGCSVIIKNINRGVACDIDGKFILNDIPPKSTILISYVGYKNKEITFAEKIPPRLNVSLQSGKGTDKETYYFDPNDKSKYFDLRGDELPSRPTKKGTYIKVDNGKPEKFIVK